MSLTAGRASSYFAAIKDISSAAFFSGTVPTWFSAIIRSKPAGPVDWDRSETLGKVRASESDVVRKEQYAEHDVLYSADGRFPILDAAGNPPVDLNWQKSRHYGLVINAETHLHAATVMVLENSEPSVRRVFQAANRAYQTARSDRPQGATRFSKSKVWEARTALYLIRLFATTIG